MQGKLWTNRSPVKFSSANQSSVSSAQPENVCVLGISFCSFSGKFSTILSPINQPQSLSQSAQLCTPAFQGLTLDIDKGNLLRLGKDGVILAASHGTRKMSDLEIEKVYGRGRKKHVAFDYATHLHVSTT